MLRSIKHIRHFKNIFFSRFNLLLNTNPLFEKFLKIVLSNNDGYVVGGFLRDIVNERLSRDIDIILNISQEELLDCLEKSDLHYKINRMSGVKIILDNFEADVWIMKNNWAFKSKVIRKNDENILRNLADGCFYNYDSLVININNGTLNVKNYNKFVKIQELDILRKIEVYKNRNPTIEANVLRALYIRKLYNINFSENCISYLAKRVIELNKRVDDPIVHIINVKSKYNKYSQILSDQEVFDGVYQLCYEYDSMKQKDVDRNQTSLYL